MPLYPTRPQMPDYSQPNVNATEATINRAFVDAILDWLDVHANHIFAELKRTSD
jgi:hypothetical protein